MHRNAKGEQVIPWMTDKIRRDLAAERDKLKAILEQVNDPYLVNSYFSLLILFSQALSETLGLCIVLEGHRR
jgi:hypothetical protein